MTVASDIKRGRLTAEEHAEIERLAGTMKNPAPGKIARRLNRHPATVNWYMITRGLVERPARYGPRPYTRNGKTIIPYSPEQDARLTALRIAGKNHREIAEIVTREFSIERTCHSVNVRLKMLASYAD